ncbi:hypothetical protein A9F13_12g02310 [Clavispora lusitaniae]|uniref:F-box domain-containing protein n=1 Tax=Clavispora lusitaniae TaxID=36911 RepID=A0AA91PYF8_CLALS|nr:hypothetical protein A9F13_12g02310 [Clavispora lusitaniae]
MMCFNPTSLQHFPPDIIARIVKRLDQSTLCNLAQTCKFLNQFATDELYRNILISVDCTYPLENGADPSKFYAHHVNINRGPTHVFSEDKLRMLISSIKHNRTIGLKIKKIKYPSDEIPLIQELISAVPKSSQPGRFSICHPEDIFERTEDTLSDIKSKSELEDILCLAHPEHLNINVTEVCNLDLSSKRLEGFYELKSISCDTPNNTGLDILESIRLNSHVKLEPVKLSVKHFSYSESSSSHLRFDSIESKVDLTKLEKLDLQVDCQSDEENKCACFPKFFNDFERFSVAHDGLPRLNMLRIKLSPSEEWLHPRDFLTTVLVPIRNFIRSFVHLEHFDMNMASQTMKMYSGSGMSPNTLNKLNQRLIEAFFFPSNNKPAIHSTLKTLKLPDFLTSFIFYKPLFHESLLHTCKCLGCANFLSYVKSQVSSFFTDTLDDVTEGTLYYLVIGLILEHLQERRHIFVIDSESRLSGSCLYDGTKDALCKVLFEEHEEIPGAIKGMEKLVITYLIHQLGPFVDFFFTNFANLEELLIHGIAFKKGTYGIRSVFDDESYPPDLTTDNGGGGVSHCDSTFGSLDILQQ